MEKKGLNLGTHITLIFASIISVFPILWILSTSFKFKEDVLKPGIHLIPTNFTLSNYQHVLSMDNYIFWKWLGNSIMIAVITTIIGLCLASTTAYAFSRFEFKGKKTLLFSFLLTQMFPGAILIVPLYNIIKNFGLLNSYTGLLIAYSTISLPFCVWMLKSFFDTIPRSLEEAAMIDGLTSFGTFWKIILPLSLPGLSVTAFFSFITAWNEFMFALTFMSTSEHYTLPVGLRTFVFEFNTDWNYMAAGAIIVSLPVLIFFFIAQKFLISGLTAGGVKG
ncbi:MAG: carbohydrate ABC transporter permease [Candidatus Sericytochromatia bacterium]|nr:carbohydrate ABC transporter permease [Candidatus Sericytochromatia bacterium]